MKQGMVYNIQRMSIQDGPGIRTTVFLKGCPLRCLWCSNPESQHAEPELLYFESLCTACGVCKAACPHEAVYQLPSGKYGRRKEFCRNCGACAAICPSKARELSGKLMSVPEIMKIVRRDEIFYANSGGGLTIGGGEPGMGGEFFLELLQAAHDDALHTTVDTCGFCPPGLFDKILELADLLLFDCKHMDPECHKALTGVDNTLILRNFRAALESGIDLRIRVPLMPGLNDSDENFSAMAAFLGRYGRLDLELMPCHMFGRNKYVALDRPTPEVEQYSPDGLEDALNRLKKNGFAYTII